MCSFSSGGPDAEGSGEQSSKNKLVVIPATAVRRMRRFGFMVVKCWCLFLNGDLSLPYCKITKGL
jgi:hypothetical protein